MPSDSTIIMNVVARKHFEKVAVNAPAEKIMEGNFNHGILFENVEAFKEKL